MHLNVAENYKQSHEHHLSSHFNVEMLLTVNEWLAVNTPRSD